MILIPKILPSNMQMKMKNENAIASSSEEDDDEDILNLLWIRRKVVDSQ